MNESGTLFEGIQRWNCETKSDLTVDEIKQRAKIGIKKEMLHGVQLDPIRMPMRPTRT